MWVASVATSFPQMIPLPGGLTLHPHLAFDVLAYALGFQLYLYARRLAARSGTLVNPSTTSLAGLWLLAGAIFGAAVGAKLLAWLEHPTEYATAMRGGDLHAWIGGKTIVGGLLGGWIGVEIAKWHVGIERSTGDLFVFPLILGTILGRVGCYLTGLDDMTHGTSSSVPWAVDFGDGVRRHPTQLYEMLFVALLACALLALNRATRRSIASRSDAVGRRRMGPPLDGTLFRLYLGGYFAFRFAVEFIKPSPKPYIGLSAIQWASLVGVIVCAWSLSRGRRKRSGNGLAFATERSVA